jgi:hypothetical protein
MLTSTVGGGLLGLQQGEQPGCGAGQKGIAVGGGYARDQYYLASRSGGHHHELGLVYLGGLIAAGCISGAPEAQIDLHNSVGNTSLLWSRSFAMTSTKTARPVLWLGGLWGVAAGRGHGPQVKPEAPVLRRSVRRIMEAENGNAREPRLPQAWSTSS